MSDDLAHDIAEREAGERERWLALTPAQRDMEIRRICAMYGQPIRTDTGVAEEVSKYLQLLPGIDQEESDGDGRVERPRTEAEAEGRPAGPGPEDAPGVGSGAAGQGADRPDR